MKKSQSTIMEFIKKSEYKNTVLSVRVNEEMRNKVSGILKRRGLKWSQFIHACFEQFLLEQSKNPEKQ